MDDMAQTLQRTSLRRLGRYLISGDDVVMGRIEDPLTERAARLSVEDRLNLALRHGGDGLEDRVRAVVEEAWEYGETFGFLAGMRAGARTALALVGADELEI